MHSRLLLIVEDDDALRTQLDELFRLEGYEVVTAADGLEALQLLAADVVPDLVLMDMHMEGLGGDDLAAELRSQGAPFPLLVLTADSQAQQCAKRVGAQGYLTKPFELPDLLNVVERLLSHATLGTA
jgi:CheY-like chemotaxis protein